MTDAEEIKHLTLALAAARADIADLLPAADADAFLISNLTAALAAERAKVEALQRAVKAVHNWQKSRTARAAIAATETNK